MKLETVFCGTPVTLFEVLDSRSQRAERQKELLQDKESRSLISFSMNTAGEIKRFPLILSAFDEGLKAIRARLPKESLLHFEESREKTGPSAFFLLTSDANEIKKEMTAIEESHRLGRLFDIDVLDADGHSLSRSALGLPPRACLICGGNAKGCSRSQAHSIELVLWRTAELLNDYFRGQAADRAASCAVRALLYEVSATPKPGLVDRNNSGSHKDMDFFTFLDSSAALIPWFRDFFCIGWDYGTEADDALFERLRLAGREAESRMFSATGGVNTHKGLIFSFAVLCGALGKLSAKRIIGGGPDSSGPLKADEVLALCRRLGACSLADFQMDPGDEPVTAGEQCHRSYGLTGARGEAASGFPSALRFGLPALKERLAEGYSLNDASILALLSLLAQVDDTNMIYRGGRALAGESKKEAGSLLSEVTPDSLSRKLSALDCSFIEKNLSPGGCADLLAVSLIFYFLEDCGMITAADETA